MFPACAAACREGIDSISLVEGADCAAVKFVKTIAIHPAKATRINLLIFPL
jgi:hypothetical protein